MRIVRSQSAVVIATLAYLAASALGGLLHRHDHGLSHSDVATCHHDDGDGNPLDHDPAAPAGHDDSSPVPLSDEDCLACRLAAQCGLVFVPVAEPGLCPLVVELLNAAPSFFVEPVQACGLARAPPIA
jgi:hypothetical protein